MGKSVELVVVQKLENALSAKIEAYFAGVIDSDPDVLEELLLSFNSEGTPRAYRRDITDFFNRMTGQPPQRSLDVGGEAGLCFVAATVG